MALRYRGLLAPFARTSDATVVLQERRKTTAEHWARTFVPERGAWKIGMSRWRRSRAVEMCCSWRGSLA